MRAIAFSAHGVSLEPHQWGKCCVCDNRFSRGIVPQTHHGIAKRSEGIRIDSWWNLFPVCSEDCHRVLESRERFDDLIVQHYYRISKYHLCDKEPNAFAGRAWILEQMSKLQLNHNLYLPPATHFVPSMARL